MSLKYASLVRDLHKWDCLFVFIWDLLLSFSVMFMRLIVLICVAMTHSLFS